MKQLILQITVVASLLANNAKWDLIWSDEFNIDGQPDSSQWSFDTAGNAWDWGNNEKQNYTSEAAKNCWIENGSLIIEARKEQTSTSVDKETKEYSSARLRTKGKGDWLQGRFEIRAKLPKGVGTWPAIWMLPTDDSYGGWPHSGEIDIMEAIGSEPETHYSTVWCTNSEDSDGDGDTLRVADHSEQFHTYIMEWNSDSLSFWVDSSHVHSYHNKQTSEKQWPFDKRFHLLLNLAVGGDWETQVDSASFPARLEVDYVRVYQPYYEAGINSTGMIHGSLWMKQVKDGIQINQNESSFASIELYHLNGQLISKRDLGFIGEGVQYIPFNKQLASGSYLVKVLTSDGNGEMKIKID